MAQYLLSVHHTDGEPYGYATDAERDAAFRAVEGFNSELQANGQWVFAGGLHPADTATMVSIGSNDETLVTDGPYGESKEHIGGFWIIEAADLDQALTLAEAGARACGGPVEVRPFQG